MQDDGIAGLAEIKRRGGVAIAQHPGTALFPSMPLTAVEKVEVDYVAPLTQIASIIAELAGENDPRVKARIPSREFSQP
jgi:two-component system chemotaxis response regulator CheB